MLLRQFPGMERLAYPICFNYGMSKLKPIMDMMAMTPPLSGRHALVTGGGTGIGAAIATALAQAGASVSLLGRRSAPLDAMAQTLPRALAIVADVTKRASVETGFASARAAHGAIDILVCNAGAAESGRFQNQDFEVWRRLMAVNLDALHHCAQAALPDLGASAGGRLVVIASTAGLKGYGYSVAYSAAKHGAIGFVRALAMELAATPVTVNAVCPGFADTDIVADAVEKLVTKTGRTAAEARRDLARFNPQGRLIDPAEVANAVLWLCSPASQSMTGQAIAVAGGEVM